MNAWLDRTLYLREQQAQGEELALYDRFMAEVPEYGIDPAGMGRLWSHYAQLLWSAGRARDAAAAYARADDAYARGGQAMTRERLTVLQNLAAVLGPIGQLDTALERLEQAEALVLANQPDSPLLWSVRDNQAMFLDMLGRWEEARALNAEVLDAVLARPDLPDELVEMTLNNRATLAERGGDLVAARRTLEALLERTVGRLGDAHGDVAYVMANLAGVYFQLGETQLAHAQLVKAAEIQGRVLGPDSAPAATYRLRAANLGAYGPHDFLVAQHAMDVLGETQQGPVLGKSLVMFAETAASEGMCVEAMSALEQMEPPPNFAPRAEEVRAQCLRSSQPTAARQALARAALAQERLAGTGGVGAHLLMELAKLTWPEDPDAARELARRALHNSRLQAVAADRAQSPSARRATAVKRRLPLQLWLEMAPDDAQAWAEVDAWRGRLETWLVTRRQVATQGDVDARRLWERAGVVERRLATARLDQDAKGVRTLTVERDRLALELSALLQQTTSTSTTPSVCADLTSTETLVEYLVHQPQLQPGPPRLLAFVVDGETCSVRRFDLGEARPLGELVEHVRGLLRTGAFPARVQGAARRLRMLVYDPLLPALPEGGRLHVRADGSLSQLPLAVLPLDDGSFLLERYEFVYPMLSHARPREPRKTGARALVVGQVDYGEGTPDAPCAATFTPLPSTAREVKEVAKALRRRARVQTITGEQADETSVGRLAANAEFVHLATHGFSLRDCPELIDPLTRTGLAFAGANAGGDAQDDGLWTAAEVASLDLSTNELVVLSACDSGVGDLVEGEGALGLARAFRVAGSREVISSLWPVPDQPTEALMSLFYRGYTRSNQHSASTSLRRAQLTLLRQQRREGRVDPAAWGAFVATK